MVVKTSLNSLKLGVGSSLFTLKLKLRFIRTLAYLTQLAQLAEVAPLAEVTPLAQVASLAPLA